MLRSNNVNETKSNGDEFLDYLMNQGELDSTGLQRVNAIMETSGQSVDTVLLELGLMPESKLADAQAAYLGLARIHPEDFPGELPSESELSPDFLRSVSLLPLEITESTVVIATAKPFDTDVIRGLAHFLAKTPVIKVAAATDLQQHLQRLMSPDTTNTDLGANQSTFAAEDDIERLKDIAREAPIIKLLNRIVSQAVEQKASDIHVEPMEDHVQVRYRIDGSLSVAEKLQSAVQQGLISRIKVLAKLNIAEHRLPQDGRIKLPVRGREVEFRVSTTPVTFGESVALRILDRQHLQLDYASLGYQPGDAATLQRMTSHPNGILLVTGPTGSGKTTTLYAALSTLNKPQVKMFTVEDPVEYRLKGVNQIQVKPAIGLDFAAILRSVLRQDPDIIMIGEIRDAETARIAVQASLTGHLVLSTLHTNSAAASVTRLLDMGLEDYLLASTLRGIVAQRLLRKLCSHCKTRVEVLSPVYTKLGISRSTEVFKACGCASCKGTGYSGRTVAYEILEIGPEERQAILDHSPESAIHEHAMESGMKSLLRTALDCVERGETSLEEVYRVVQGPTL
jgi:general secretion pathway protein E